MNTLWSRFCNFAHIVWDVPRRRHILFFSLAILIVSLYGYYFGTFDQASHIPFLKKNIDPSLFPGDFFFTLRNTHYSYFWLLFIPLQRAGILEFSLFAIHVFATYATFWALWEVSKTLFNNPQTALLTVFAFIFPHIGFSGFPLFEFSLLNRTVCLPFELFAMNLYLKRKPLRALFLLGLIYNFHALSVHFFAGMLFFDLLARTRKEGIKNLVGGIFVFIGAALPVFIWKFSHSGVHFASNPDWFDILNRAVFFHLFNFVSVYNWHILFLTAGGVAATYIFFKISSQFDGMMHHSVRNWYVAGLLLLGVQQIATMSGFAPTLLIQSQVMRIGIILIIFTYLYASSYCIAAVNKSGGILAFFWGAALLLSMSPILFMGVLLVHNRKAFEKIRTYFAPGLLLFYLLLLVGTIILNIWGPGFFIFPQHTPFADAQRWAKQHTPKSAVFITPPEIWWMYETEWRVLSERSTVSTLSELLEAAFDPAYIPYWKSRFEDLAPGALAQFKGNFFENKQLIRDAYYSNSPERFLQLGKKYNASYLVSDTQHSFPFPKLYGNKGYAIYLLKRTSR